MLSSLPFRVGDRVESPEKEKGTVVYFGPVFGREDTWVGVEYDEPVGEHTGYLDGYRYFSCPQNKGTIQKVSYWTKLKNLDADETKKENEIWPFPTRVHSLDSFDSDLIQSLRSSTTSNRYNDVTFLVPVSLERPKDPQQQAKSSDPTESKQSEGAQFDTLDGLDDQPLDSFEPLDANKNNDIDVPAGIRAYPCIRALFGMNSVVLDAMLFGGMQESHANSTIELLDIDAASFEFVRDFVYRLNPTLTAENVVGILHASHKYMIPKLEKVCLNFIKQRIFKCDVDTKNSTENDQNNQAFGASIVANKYTQPTGKMLDILCQLHNYGLLDMITDKFLPLLSIHTMQVWIRVYDMILHWNDDEKCSDEKSPNCFDSDFERKQKMSVKLFDAIVFDPKSPFAKFVTEFDRKARSKFSLHRKYTHKDAQRLHQKLWHLCVTRCKQECAETDQWRQMMKVMFLDNFEPVRLGLEFFTQTVVPLDIIDSADAFEQIVLQFDKDAINEMKVEEVINLLRMAYINGVDLNVIKSHWIKNIKVRTNFELSIFWNDKNWKELVLYPKELFEVMLFDAATSPVALINKGTTMKECMWDLCVKWCKHHVLHVQKCQIESSSNCKKGSEWKVVLNEWFIRYFKPLSIGCEFYVNNIALEMVGVLDKEEMDRLRKCCIYYSKREFKNRTMAYDKNIVAMIEFLNNLEVIGLGDLIESHFVENISITSRKQMESVKNHKEVSKLSENVQKIMFCHEKSSLYITLNCADDELVV